MDEQGPAVPRALAGRYVLGPVVGRGAMGVVRSATDERLGRPVAVKFLRSDLAELPKARRRFEQEALAVARLSHPNVVIVFDSGEEDGIPYLVMERLSGTTLADEMTAGPLPVERVCAVAREVLGALGAAHRAGIIHRDIKPGNVLLADDGHVKVSDFGIAKTVDELDQTQTTQLIATPAYLAPERLAGEPASSRSDLYSVGVMLYEALSGRRPFPGATPLAVMGAVERARPEPLTSEAGAIPPRLIDAVTRAMSADPRQRFASADDMAAAIEPAPPRVASETFADTVPVAIEPRAGEPAADTVPVTGETHDGETRTLHRSDLAPTAPATPMRAHKRSGAFAAAAAAVVALLVAGAALQSRHHTSAASTSTTTSAPPSTPAPRATLPAPLDDAIRRLERAVGS